MNSNIQIYCSNWKKGCCTVGEGSERRLSSIAGEVIQEEVETFPAIENCRQMRESFRYKKSNKICVKISDRERQCYGQERESDESEDKLKKMDGSGAPPALEIESLQFPFYASLFFFFFFFGLFRKEQQIKGDII